MHNKYEERNSILYCKYCGSVTKDFMSDADEVLRTDKSYKFYVIKNGKQYKFYTDHLNA